MGAATKVERKRTLVRLNKPLIFTAKSGLQTNALDDEWRLLPTTSKGCVIPIAWLHNSTMSDEDWHLCVEVYVHYASTKAASTAYGIVCNTEPHFLKGIPNLTALKAKWSGVPKHQKKSLNQFFLTLNSLGYKRFAEFHEFTKRHLDKETKNTLDPTRGAMSDFEFDSLAKLINTTLGRIDWSEQQDLSFYKSNHFNQVRNAVSNKLMLAVVRRPIQLSVLKWRDLIPTGASFKDQQIDRANELGTLGSPTLQLRVFKAKETGNSNQRAHPERYPIPLSEDLSATLVHYKRLCLQGLTLTFQESQLEVSDTELIHLAENVPIFPDTSLYGFKFDSLELFNTAFTEASTLFHVADGSITMDIRNIPSDRLVTCKATNNRIRHTILTRGAQAGLPAVQLARMTGVTVPAARHYIDLDYTSRRLIDIAYVGNEFLRQAFFGAVSQVPEGEEIIVGHDFADIGGARNAKTCRSCKTALGRPTGCYGCPNFRPILEGDHRAELQVATNKLEANRNYLLNPLEVNTIRKLQTQIGWIKLTIEVCDELIAGRKAIDAQ